MPLFKFLRDLFKITPEPVPEKKIHPLDGPTRVKEAPYKIEAPEVVVDPVVEKVETSTPVAEPVKVESAKVESAKVEPVKVEEAKVEAAKAEPASAPVEKKTRKSPVRRTAEKTKTAGKKPANATKSGRGRKPKAKKP